MSIDFDLSLNNKNNCIIEFADGDDVVCFYKDTTGYPESKMGMVRRLFIYSEDDGRAINDVGEMATTFFSQEHGKDLVYIISKKTIDRKKVDYYYKYNVLLSNLEIFFVMDGDKVLLDSGDIFDKKFRNKWVNSEEINDTLYLTAIVNHQGKRNRAPQMQEDTARLIDL